MPRVSATCRSSRSVAGQPVWDAVLGDEIGIGLPGTYDAPLLAMNQDFGQARTGIVVTGHHRARASGRQMRYKTATFALRKMAARGEKIGGHAVRPDHVIARAPGTGYRDGGDVVMGVIHGGAYQIIHPGI